MNNTITPIHCHYNMDTACVELLLSDATIISINTHNIEAHLALSDKIHSYLQGTPEHQLPD